jgi:hypothetical protein
MNFEASERGKEYIFAMNIVLLIRRSAIININEL